MAKKRPSMLGSVIRQVIAPVLRECPRACGIVTITDIEVSEDFSYATVYMSALKEPQLAIDFLNERLRDLQSQVFKSLGRSRVPELRFRHDPRSERGANIDRLLG